MTILSAQTQILEVNVQKTRRRHAQSICFQNLPLFENEEESLLGHCMCFHSVAFVHRFQSPETEVTSGQSAQRFC